MVQLVIKIPDAPIQDYQDLLHKIYDMAASEGLFDDKVKSQKALALKVVLDILGGIVNGTPLPEGHGDLVDRNDLLAESYVIDDYAGNEINIIDRMTVEMVDAIIEADKESEL